MRMIYVLGLSLAGAAVLAAVDAGTSGARDTSAARAPIVATEPAPDIGGGEVLPPNHPPIGDDVGGPTGGEEAPQAVVEGEVKEVLQVDKYTYLRLASAAGEQWAAVPHQEVAVGKRVRIGDPTEMQGFSSPTLGRTFDRIWFGVLDESGAGSPHGGSSGSTAAPSTGAVAKAEGAAGHTVAEVVKDAAKLRDTTVRVRGKVTKLTAGVLGKTWLHVSDGDKSDLVVTTTGATSVGAVVLLEGRVATDRDLGSGYRYPVLLDDAKIVEGNP